MDRYGMRQPYGAGIATPSRMVNVKDGEYVKYSDVKQLEVDIAEVEAINFNGELIIDSYKDQVKSLECENKTLKKAILEDKDFEQLKAYNVELEEKVNRLELSIEDYEGYRGVDEDRIKSLEDVLELLIECSLLNTGHHTAARTARKVLLAKKENQE